MNTNKISKRLEQLGFPVTVLNNYQEPHRFYHTAQHLLEVLQYLENRKWLSDELLLATVYHDSVYDPKEKDNEERSAKLFAEHAKKTKLKKEQVKKIAQCILDTKNHKATMPESQRLIEADLDIFNQSLERLIAYEKQIFKEFQFVDYNIYQKERIKVLEKYNEDGKLDHLISYVKQRKPFIGLFCGSFNPFHKGHNNVLQKAEKIFDKVIIAFGKNPEKNGRHWKVPGSLRYRQLEEYSGLLTDFVASLNHDVVVIRGLRNSTDFQYEQNQYRYIQELMPEIRIVNIFCDKEFEHISSSGIRTLEKFGKHHNYLLE